MSKNANNFSGSPLLRGGSSPRSQSRQASIVEMLSTPPPLEPQLSNSSVNSGESVGKTFAHAADAGRAVNLRRGVSSGSSSYQRNQPQFPGKLPVQPSGTPQQQLYSSSGLSRSSSTASSILAGTSLEWQDIPLSELVQQNKLIVIRDKLSVEEAFKTLLNNGLTSVPVEHCPDDPNCLTFDYTDLNAYLLLVMKKISQESLTAMEYEPRDQIPALIHKAQRGEQVPVSFVIRISAKNPFIKLTEADTLSQVVEILGTGVHRIAITNKGKLTGVLSQRRLIKFLWDNARRFPSMEPLLTSSLQRLNIGSPNPVAIFGDQLLIEAFMKMHNLKISSLAVVDRNYRLLGNISVTDVRLVSRSSKSELLFRPCLHFISVILNSRGIENGQDSFPIFHVTPSSSLARTIAKLVATKAHRLWIVQPDTPATAPANQTATPISPTPTAMHPSSSSVSSELSANASASVVQEKEITNGKLIGVLSLTDILSVLAKSLGKNYVDPNIARQQRRRSSSSASSRTSGSLDQVRKC